MKTKLFASILIMALIAIIAGCDDDVNILPVESVDCGDVNGDGQITLLDITILDAYLFGGTTQAHAEASDIDGLAGITTNDYEYLANFIFQGGTSPNCTALVSDTILPISADTLYFANPKVAPNNDTWTIRLFILNTTPIDRLTLPFSFTCSTSPIFCDSIVRRSLIPKITDSKPVQYGGLIDTAGQRAILSYGDIIATAAGDMQPLADIYFCLTASADTQLIVIDTTTYPPSHFPILSRFVAPNTSAFTPEVEHIETP